MFVKLDSGEVLKVYKYAEEIFPSVTQVLDIVAQPWVEGAVDRLGLEELNRRRDAGKLLGSRVHDVAESIALNGCTPSQCLCVQEIDSDLLPYHQAVTSFHQNYVKEVLGVETEYKSPELKLGGKVDLFARLHDGSTAIIDFKTSAKITPKNGLQLIAYSIMMHLQGLSVDKRVIIWLKKDYPGEYYPKVYEDHQGDAEAFLALLKYWHWQYGPLLDKKLKSYDTREMTPTLLF